MRTTLYLLAVLPATWLIAFCAFVPAALLLPPDIVLQAILSVPIFCLVGGWTGGWFINRFAVPSDHRSAMQRRRISVFVGCLHAAVIVVFGGLIVSGIATPQEASIIVALATIIAHAVAFRRWSKG